MGLEVRRKHGRSALADGVRCNTSNGERQQERLPNSVSPVNTLRPLTRIPLNAYIR